jgi:hypothetical protein
VAYVSDESGVPEVFVAPFAGAGESVQVSGGGGADPRWRADGTELFYWEGNRLMAVTVNGRGPAFVVGQPAALFERSRRTQGGRSSYDVAADGQRFLVNTIADAPSPITLIVNWPALLTERRRP